MQTETAVALKWIAAQLHVGTWTHVANRLSKTGATPTDQTGPSLCQK